MSNEKLIKKLTDNTKDCTTYTDGHPCILCIAREVKILIIEAQISSNNHIYQWAKMQGGFTKQAIELELDILENELKELKGDK